MAIPAFNPGRPIEEANQGFLIDKVSKMAKLAKRIGEIALKVLESLAAIVVMTAICIMMGYFMSGGNPIAIPLGIIGGIWQGILASQKIWEE